MTASTLNKSRSLILPAVATLIALAILIGLGTWQLQRKAWKEGLVQQIESRAYGKPGAILPESEWARWRADQDEFRRVQVSGTFLHDLEAHIYGLAPGSRQGAPLQGYYIITPLRLTTGGIVMINRGFVPTDLKNPATRPQSQPQGQVTITGLVRAPEAPTIFTPNNDPARNLWFTRNPQLIAEARGLESVAPFLIDADATPNPGGWPRGGQTQLTLPNNHLQYALTWYGIALTLVAVFGAFAWKRMQEPNSAKLK